MVSPKSVIIRNYFILREKGELRMKKLIYFIAVIMLCAVPVSGVWAAPFIYANSYEGTPVFSWEIGKTYRPPTIPGNPEHALGAPEDGLSGWATGWKNTTGGLIVGFDCEFGLGNVEGDDLTIWHFGKGSPEVYASIEPTTDPTTWHWLGSLDSTLYPKPDFEYGSGSVAQDFEFGDLDGVFYIKIEKDEGGMGTGHFIDAVGGVQCVPIPGSVLLLGSGIIGMLCPGRKKRG